MASAIDAELAGGIAGGLPRLAFTHRSVWRRATGPRADGYERLAIAVVQAPADGWRFADRGDTITLDELDAAQPLALFVRETATRRDLADMQMERVGRLVFAPETLEAWWRANQAYGYASMRFGDEAASTWYFRGDELASAAVRRAREDDEYADGIVLAPIAPAPLIVPAPPVLAVAPIPSVDAVEIVASGVLAIVRLGSDLIVATDAGIREYWPRADGVSWVAGDQHMQALRVSALGTGTRTGLSVVFGATRGTAVTVFEFSRVGGPHTRRLYETNELDDDYIVQLTQPAPEWLACTLASTRVMMLTRVANTWAVETIFYDSLVRIPTIVQPIRSPLAHAHLMVIARGPYLDMYMHFNVFKHVLSTHSELNGVATMCTTTRSGSLVVASQHKIVCYRYGADMRLMRVAQAARMLPSAIDGNTAMCGLVGGPDGNADRFALAEDIMTVAGREASLRVHEVYEVGMLSGQISVKGVLRGGPGVGSVRSLVALSASRLASVDDAGRVHVWTLPAAAQ